MTGRASAVILCVVGVALAGLLLTGRMSSRIAGASFALALVVLGLLSGGFQKRNR